MNRSPEICQESDRRVIKNSAGKYGKKVLVYPFEGYCFKHFIVNIHIKRNGRDGVQKVS